VSQTTRPAPGPWREAGPELAIAAVTLVAVAVAAYFVAGILASVLVVTVFAAIALAVVSRLVPGSVDLPEQPDSSLDWSGVSGSFTSFWRWRNGLAGAMQSRASYEANVGRKLEHLLAARLSEHHGVSLYSEPDQARDLLCRSGDGDLWQWVDPSRGPAPSTEAPGIPGRTLARLVKRLEQL
jgi:hypothetical protein